MPKKEETDNKQEEYEQEEHEELPDEVEYEEDEEDDEEEEEDEEDSDDDEYETVDITENEQYQVGSAFFENQDGDGIAEILTNLVKVHISLVDSIQEMIKKQGDQVSATNTLSKVVQKYCKKLDEKV